MNRQSIEDTKPILIVDDDLSTRVLISDALREGGYRSTQEVANGFEALNVFRKGVYDLVISDMQMPGMTGIELLSCIKEIDPAIPVIIMTAYPSIDLSVYAMKEGAIDFLSKPFQIEDLIFKVNLYLRERSILTEGDLNLEVANWRLHEKIEELSTIGLIYERIEKTDGNNDDIFREMATLALKLTGGETCLLVLYDEANQKFLKKLFQTNGNGHGTCDFDKAETHRQLQVIFREVVQKKEALRINSARIGGNRQSVICAPLLIRNKVFGLLTVNSTGNKQTFSQKDLSYIINLTDRASLHLENKLLYESMFGSIMDTFESLVHSIHVRDHYTERHSRCVTKFALETARAMQCSAYEIESLKISSLLHDVGKIAIPDYVLLKPGRLTEEEYRIIKDHSTIGENILQSVALFEEERKVIRHHHERWDGRGYPDGLAGEEIPLLARILAVSDTFDAMTSDRPYRKGLKVTDAIEELRRNSGSQFDKEIVDIFISTLQMKHV